MSTQTAQKSPLQLDLSDVEPRVGKLVGGGQLWEPCTAMDIRRWVMAMDYPNPIHWDQEFARNSKFGGIVAPQSFAVGLDYGHGVQPACVGRIPGSHLIFGGEEWWFYGHRIRPGDKLFQERRFHDYKVTDTKFAGPTMFSRGDTTHTNQNGTLVARERSTAIRYLAAEAERRGMFQNQATMRFEEVQVGDRLPRRVLGPHSIASFATEYRAFLFNIWGSFEWVSPAGVKDPWINQDPGWIEGFGFDEEGARIDPRKRDGLYLGPSRGHVDGQKGVSVGIPRAYGYGATMGAWALDYLGFWAGNDGMVRHSKMQFRGPSFEGDVTYVDGEVAAKEAESAFGVPLVSVKVRMTNQEGVVLVDGVAELELPLV